MNVTLSPAEVGAIVYAMESVYSGESPEMQIVDFLCKRVYEHFDQVTHGDPMDLYDTWLDEFEII